MEGQKTELKMIRMSEVESQEVKWLWYPFIPYEPVNVIYQTAEDGLADDMEFYKGKIKDMSDRTELLQEKADDLESVKRYAGAEQIDTIIRKVKE